MTELINRTGLPVFIQIVLESWNGVFLLIMLFSLIIGKRSDRKTNTQIPLTNELIIFYAAIFLYDFFDILYCALNGSTSLYGKIINPVSNFFYFSVGAFLTLFFLQLVKKQVAEKNGLIKIQKITSAIQFLHVPCLILLVLTPFTKALYWFDENNNYQRGQFYWVWYGATIISFIYIALVCLVLYRRIERFTARVIALSALIPLVAFICGFAYSKISFNNISVIITALIVFTLYEKHRTDYSVENAHKVEKLRTQLAETKNEVLMAQIQPHFINNSLMAIQAQCINYPEVYKSLSDFSLYLRSNFEALGRTKPITFEQEMESVQAYIDLEQRNFGERLNVEYDIGFDDFYVPPLSVQPLVENAVRHGVATYDKGGTVWIKVRREVEKIIIEIIDDGSGSTNITPQQKRRKGIGIENSRSRIESMANGSLDIITTPNGTISRITLQEQKEGKTNDNTIG